jgi:hypothetical protein
MGSNDRLFEVSRRAMLSAFAAFTAFPMLLHTPPQWRKLL